MKQRATTVDTTVKQALDQALQRFASNQHGNNAS